MAIIYYPTSTVVNQRAVSGSAYVELDLQVVPNTVFFFNTSSVLDYATASIYPYTTSYAMSASFAINAAEGGTTLITGGFYPITASRSLSSSHGDNASYAALSNTASYSTSGSAAIVARTSSFSFSSSFANTSPTVYVSYNTSSSDVHPLIFGPFDDGGVYPNYYPMYATNVAKYTPTTNKLTVTSSVSLSSSVSISSSYATSASWSDSALSTSYTDYVSSASYGVSSSWASASFTASHALTASYFDDINNATGLLVEFYDTASTETNTSLANTAGNYKASTSRITINSPISLVSMSIQVAVSGTYHVYYSTNSSSYDNIGWIAISYSFTNATTSYNFLLEPTKHWWDNTIFVTVQRTDNTSLSFRRGNGAFVGTYWSSNYSSFTGSGGLVDGAYGFPGSLTFYGYSGLYEYGNSLTTSSYSNTSVAAISSSWASSSLSASYIGGYTGNVYILDGDATTQHSMSFADGVLTSYTKA